MLHPNAHTYKCFYKNKKHNFQTLKPQLFYFPKRLKLPQHKIKDTNKLKRADLHLAVRMQRKMKGHKEIHVHSKQIECKYVFLFVTFYV